MVILILKSELISFTIRVNIINMLYIYLLFNLTLFCLLCGFIDMLYIYIFSLFNIIHPPTHLTPPSWTKYLHKYSPYHNLKKGVHYPSTLYMTSTRDDRVHPAHARKMVHRSLDLGYAPLYYENIEGGHGGASNNRQVAFGRGLFYRFMDKELVGGRPKM